jgi:universal stress protein E
MRMGKILVIADLEDNCYATPRGLELAGKLGVEAEVVAFTHVPLQSLKVKSPMLETIKKRLLTEREKQVKTLVDKYRKQGQKVELFVEWEKDIARWINRRCAAGDYLWVIKTGNRTESLVHSSTDWQLLRECPTPVLLVAEKKWHRTKPVLVTLDLSTKVAAKRALNRKLLGVARDLAQTLEVNLEIITAIEIPTLLSDLDLVDPIAFVKDATADMQPQIRKLAAEFDMPESAFLCKRGPVEKVITSRAAAVRAQIVVLGTVARKGVKARLLGNTAERVLRHLRTDVLAIKP